MNKRTTSYKLESAVAVIAVLFLSIGIFSAGNSPDAFWAGPVGVRQTPTPKSPSPDPKPRESQTPLGTPVPENPKPKPTPASSATQML